MGVSPPVVVTEAAAEFTTPTATPASLGPAGGAVVVSGQTSDPDGTTLTLFDGTTNTGITTTTAGGAYTFPPYTVPPNTTLTPAQHSLTAQSPL